nr:malonyl-coenzyme:anthocyanin 5-O-glucoside-6'''-O-malonyltransferase-like [Ipomoea batatas]
MSRRIVRVAQDGSGDYRTVQEAIDSVPLRNASRTVITIAPGVYRQPVYVPKTKNLITLAGLRPEDTVLTWNNTATKIDHHQTPRVIGTGTFGCGSTIVEGEDFIAENITFENYAPQPTTLKNFDNSYLVSTSQSSSMATVISRVQVAPAGNATEMSLPLTLFDMPWLFLYRIMRRLLFYRLPISRDTFIETICPKLVSSLSLTLTHFLPLAGNLVSPSDSCIKPELRYMPGDSVSITFAESGDDFNSLIGNHPRDVNDFYPFVPRLTEEKHIGGAQIVVPILAVQVTFFPGFGLCIGTTHHHVAGDGNTMMSFVKAWAMISKLGGDLEFIAEKSPQFYDRSIVNDPYGVGDLMFEEMKKVAKVELSEAEISTPRINKVRATYIMRWRDIEKLKNLVAARQRAREVHISAFTVTCAYVWTSLVKARVAIGEQSEDNKMEYFSCVADCRSRLNPPLPASYFGNCLVRCFVKSKHGVLVGSEGFLTAAELIGETVQERVNDQEWILNREVWLSELKISDPQRVVAVAGYPRLDIYAADFGWGKPEKVEFVTIDGGNLMSICKGRDSEGDIEIGLAMPRTKMDAISTIFADGLRNF